MSGKKRRKWKCSRRGSKNQMYKVLSQERPGRFKKTRDKPCVGHKIIKGQRGAHEVQETGLLQGQSLERVLWC